MTISWGEQNPLLALYVCVFVDLFAVGIIVPLLPYYVSSHGAEKTTYGMLISIYGKFILPIFLRLEEFF